MIEEIDNIIWVEKYRPTKVEDCILPKNVKKLAKAYVKGGEITSHLLLPGAPGIGKTTLAKAMLAEIDADYMFVNASLDRNIDVLRTNIMEYGSRVSMLGKPRKYVILDEADSLGPTFQPALRGAMEELSVNCGFILTCNYVNKIIEPVRDRCSIISFPEVKGDEKKELLKQAVKRFSEILTNEEVKFDMPVLLQHVNRHFPNFRKALNELQAYCKLSNGILDSGIFTDFSNSSLKDLLEYMRDKRFMEMRKWVGENSSTSIEDISKYLYDNALELIQKESIPQLVLHLADYDYKSQFVINKEILLAAMLTAIMQDVDSV